ncbi:MAG TPA: hypothetical protein VNJ01_17305 [Bacteriovoracaceae bacterium]|nr:hypothetical protein [Bacteriovoracaceae bacterium]
MQFLAFLALFLPAFCMSASVLIIEPQAQSCQVKKMLLPSKKEEPLFRPPSCPKRLLISNSGKFFYSDESGSIFTLANKKTEKIGEFPTWSMSLMLDEKGRLVAGYLKDLKESDFSSTGEGDKRTENFSFEGKKYVSKDLPPWGVPYMAIAEVFENGKWTRIEVAPTKSEAGDTPQLSVLKKISSKTNGVSLEKLQMDSTCYSSLLNCNTQHPFAKKLLGEREGYGEIKTKSGAVFLFNVIYGDTPHASSPVFFLDSGAKDGIKINEERNQISLSMKDDLVLIGNEYDNKVSKLYDGNGEMIMAFPPSAQVVWYPE